MFGMYSAGIVEVDEADVLERTGYKRTDSPGYRNTMKALTKELKQVIKKAGKLSLTQAGLDYVSAHGVQFQVSAPTLEENQSKLRGILLENAAITHLARCVLCTRSQPATQTQVGQR